MRLYHGSKLGLKGAIKPESRTACDFGSGFYMGTESTQPLTLICNAPSPKFYEMDLNLEGLNVHRFEPDLEWAMFVAWNRRVIPFRFRSYYDEKFLPIVRSNDVIVGKIANDRMVVVMDWFFRGFISDVGFVKSLQALGLGDQYCAITHSACSRISIQNERPLSESECAELRAKSQMSRAVAVKMVDRIRLELRRDGLSFMEIIERETGEKWYDA